MRYFLVFSFALMAIENSWAAATKTLKVIQHLAPVHSASFSFDGHFVASASLDGEVKMQYLASQKEKSIRLNDAALEVRFSPDSKFLAIRTDSNQVVLWRHSDDKKLFISHSEKIQSFNFSQDSQKVATASQDNTVKVLDLKTEVIIEIEHEADVNDVLFHPNKNVLMTASTDGRARIIDLDRNPLDTGYGVSFKDWATSLVINSNGSVVAVGSDDKKIGILMVDDGMGHMIPRDSATSVLKFSPSDRFLLIGDWGGSATILSLRSLKTFGTIRHGLSIHRADFSPDNQFVFTTSNDDSLKILKLMEGSVVRFDHKDWVWNAEFSSNSRYIATASFDHTAKLIRLSDFKEIDVIEHQAAVTVATFSPDSRFLLTASTDSTVKITSVP